MLCMSQVRSLQTFFLLIRITKKRNFSHANKYSESEEGSADAAMRTMLAQRE